MSASMRKWTRCAKCRDWYVVGSPGIAAGDCPCCEFKTSRCARCGGADGVERSLRVHFSFFRAQRAGAGGHSFRRLDDLRLALREGITVGTEFIHRREAWMRRRAA